MSSSRPLTSNMGKYLAPLAGMWLSNALVAEDPFTLWTVRGLFFLELLVAGYCYFRIYRAIEGRQGDATTVTYSKESSVKTAKGKKRKENITVSIYDYEWGVLKTEIATLIIGAIIVGAIHIGFQAFSSVVIAICTGPLQLFDSPLVQVYVMERDVSRPFSEPETMLSSMKTEFSTIQNDFSTTTTAAAPSAKNLTPLEAFRLARGVPVEAGKTVTTKVPSQRTQGARD